MPEFELDQQQIDDLIDYLKSLEPLTVAGDGVRLGGLEVARICDLVLYKPLP